MSTKNKQIAVRMDERLQKDLQKIVRLMDVTSRYRVEHTMSDAVRYAVTLAVSLLASNNMTGSATSSSSAHPRETESGVPYPNPSPTNKGSESSK